MLVEWLIGMVIAIALTMLTAAAVWLHTEDPQPDTGNKHEK